MQTSADGRALIEGREGRELRAYRDSEDVLTIGAGHTGRMAPPAVTPGMTITEAQCDAFLAADLAPVEASLAKALKVPVTQNEFDAMASWAFNVGTRWVAKSTIVKKLNLGDIAGAAAGFDLYHKPASIIGRRNGEKAQFLRPDATTTRVVDARGSALSTMADKARSTATTAAGAAIGTGVVGTAIAAGTVSAYPTGSLAAGGIGLVVALLSGILSWLQFGKAATLDANADAHAAQLAALS